LCSIPKWSNFVHHVYAHIVWCTAVKIWHNNPSRERDSFWGRPFKPVLRERFPKNEIFPHPICIRHVTEFEFEFISDRFWHFFQEIWNPADSLTNSGQNRNLPLPQCPMEFGNYYPEIAFWLCPIQFLAIPINQKTTTRINYSMFIDSCHMWCTLLVIPDDWIYYSTERWLLLIIENGLNLSIINSFCLLCMQLILFPVLAPVPAPYGIDPQNLHLTDTEFSWLHHIPNIHVQCSRHLIHSYQSWQGSSLWRREG